jgi:hypothetical protein
MAVALGVLLFVLGLVLARRALQPGFEDGHVRPVRGELRHS